MIPILYSSSESTYTSNGLGRLSDCIQMRCSESRNGIFECEFDYPMDGAHFEDIQEGRQILISHDESGDLQPLDIYGRSSAINGVVTFYAHHISYRLNGITCKPFKATSLADTITKIGYNAIGTNPFTISTDKSVASPFSLDLPKPIRSILGGEEGSLLDVYGTGEYKFDRFNVQLLLNRGSDNGVTIRYGKNLLDLQDEISFQDAYNGIVPYWFGETRPDDGSEGEEVIVTLSEWVLYKTGATFDGRNKVIPVDFSGDFEEKPTEAELRTRAQEYLDSINPLVPTDTLTVDFVELSQTEEYSFLELQQVNLCDIVTVIFEDLGINVKLKVIEVEWDVLGERYNKITLGDSPTTYAEAITQRLSELSNDGLRIARIARQWASNAFSVASNTDQYFWFTETGNDTGAHITQIPRLEFLEAVVLDRYSGGGNLLANTNGIAIREGLAELATFVADGIQIGMTADPHATFTAEGMKVFADSGYPIAQFGATTVIGDPNFFNIQITENELGFYNADEKIAYLSNQELYIPRAVVVDTLQMGDWRWDATDANHLTLRWIGA